MNRKDLIETLELVRPALSDDPLVPIFTNFCFDGAHVFAYRDSIGILAPCETNEKFAVHGKTFMELLRAGSAEEVDLTVTTGELVLKCGKSKMKMPYFGEEDFIFEEPENDEWPVLLSITESLLEGLGLCLQTATTNNTMPAFMGVTLVSAGAIHLYSSDGDAISRYNTKVKNKNVGSYILPSAFCESLLRITAKTEMLSGTIYIDDDWVVAELDNDIKVFGRIIENPDPFDFEKQIEKVVTGLKEFVPVPANFSETLKRAMVISEIDTKPTILEIVDNRISMITKSHMGEVRDTVRCHGHPDITVGVSARLVNRAIAVCDQMAVLEQVSVFQDGDVFFQVVANMQDV